MYRRWKVRGSYVGYEVLTTICFFFVGEGLIYVRDLTQKNKWIIGVVVHITFKKGTPVSVLNVVFSCSWCVNCKKGNLPSFHW